jgi:RNA polymerase sigma-70 factor (family 1)
MPEAQRYNEKVLLILAAGGDRESFARLYSQYLDQVCKYVFLFTRSREISEEIVQDVFVRLWECREVMSTVNSFPSYLFRAARNKSVDYIRRRQAEQRGLAGYRTERTDLPETPDEAFDYKACQHLMAEAIKKLPQRRRLIFLMKIERGLSHDDIARELKISKSAVKNQLYDASDFVRSHLS